MSTVMKSSTGSMFPSPAMPQSDESQLRHDRWTAAVVVAIVVAMMALIVWLASLGGGASYEVLNYWP